MANTGKSCLYRSTVIHERLKRVTYRFSYRVASLYVNLDEIGELDRRLKLFSHNRFNLFAFYDRDHGPRDGSSLRAWIDTQLIMADIDLAGGPVYLLCMPRILGYVFNPLSVWLCYHADGALRAVLYEVSNTHGQSHSYLLPVARTSARGQPLLQSCVKAFYVSPFMDMNARYEFRVMPPGDRLSILIRQFVGDQLELIASQQGRRLRLTDRILFSAFWRLPLMTHKVILAIHWQALRIWIRGGRYRMPPAPPGRPVTLQPPLYRNAR